MKRRPVLFYGVNSEGMGHATRARPVIEALSRHYDLHIFCGGRTRSFLRQHFPAVHRVWFGKLVYRNNVADVRSTVIRSFLEGPWVLLSGAYVTLMALLKRPVAIISDFECLSAWAGMLTFTPVITLDNQMLLKHGALPPLPPSLEKDADVVRHVMFWNTPVVRKALVTSFFQPGLKPSSVRAARFVPLAVREGVLRRMQQTRTDGRVLVYQTSTTNDDLPGTLCKAAAELGLQFAVYGSSRTGEDGAVAYRAFSEEGFLDELARAPFVIVNGGHSTIVEAMALGKPVLAEPVKHQFEQAINVVGLEALGIGRGTEKLAIDDIRTFVRDLDAMRAQLRGLELVDNQALVRTVMETIVEVSPERAIQPVIERPRLRPSSSEAPQVTA